MRPMTILPTLFSLSLGALVTVSFASPAAAQDAAACTNEVQRMSESFPTATGDQPGTIAQQPGTRQGAGMNAAQQSQMRDTLQQARTAGQSGNGALCMENLNQARTMLRQAGVGSPAPGGTAAPGSTVVPGSAGTDIRPDLQGDQAPPQLRTPSTGVPGGTTNMGPSTPGGAPGTGAPNTQGAQTPASPPATRGTTGGAGTTGGGGGGAGGGGAGGGGGR